MPILSILVLRCLAVGTGLGLLVAAIPSPGCANTTAGADVDTNSMDRVKLGDRDFLLYVPRNYDPPTPAPLILSYHGGSRDAEHQAQLDQFNSTFFNKDYLVVYPNAVNVHDPGYCKHLEFGWI